MKKLSVFLVLVLFAMVSVFAAGSSEETDTASGVTEIVFWHRMSDDFAKEIELFESQNPDIKVVSEAVGTNYDDLYTKYMTAIASDSLPNVGIVGQRHGISQMYESGKLLPIENFIGEDVLNDIMPGYWGRFIYDGKRVCVPFASSVPVLYYNADLFAEVGIEPPTSFKDIPEIAKQVTRDTDGDGKNDIYGFNFNSDTPWYIQPWVWDLGYEVILATDKASVDNDGYRGVFNAIHQMVHVDKSMPANQHSTGLDDFKNGYSAMFLTSSANLAQFVKDANFTVGVAALPGKNTILGGNSLGIFDGSEKELEASAKFINFLLSVEGSMPNMDKGYLPVRQSFLEDERVKALIESEPRRMASINSVEKLASQGVNVADSTIWLETIDILSEVEANSNADINKLLKDFQATVDQFYNDYY